MVDSSTDVRKQLKKLEKRQRKLGDAELTGSAGQFCELFFESLDNGKQLLTLAKNIADELDASRRRNPAHRRGTSAKPAAKPVHNGAAISQNI